MEPTSAVALSEVVIALITAIGVGNFILVAVVLGLVLNAPTIINNLIKTKATKSLVQDVKNNFLKAETKLLNVNSTVEQTELDIRTLNNEIKALVAIVDLLHSSLEKESSERREENILIINNLEKLSSALESIDRIMRNVISEEDSSRLFTFILGIENSFRNSILDKTLSMIEYFNIGKNQSKKEEFIRDLKNDIYSEWSDFKSKVNQFNTPVRIESFLDNYEKQLWSKEKGGLFYEILKIAVATGIETSLKKKAIAKQLNIGLRRLHSDMTNYLHNGKRNNNWR